MRGSVRKYLGVTGSGKTFTMANVIAQLGRPALILAHNKTLAAQLYQEFKAFFPHNAVEYFVSYYDYYQPEAYIARTDTYIEKDLAINDEIDPLLGRVKKRLDEVTIYPGSHHVTPDEVRLHAVETIRTELQERIAYFEKENKLLEKQRIEQRTKYDIEMMKEIGFCKGIENYSRHFSQRQAGDPPPCLLDYFVQDFLLFIDESHQTLPQLHAMYNGDRSRKEALVTFGFRLPSAFDNRPLKFEEVYEKLEI